MTLAERMGVSGRGNSTDGAASVPGQPKRRLARGHWVALVLGLLAFLVNMAVLRDRSDVVSVAVADEAISPGTVVTESMVRFVEVPADSPLADSVVEETLLTSGELVSTRQLAEDEPLSATAVVGGLPDDGLRVMSVPVPTARAAGGTLQAGDRVDVLYIDGGGRPVYAAADVEILSLGGSADSTDEEGGYYVILAVDADEAACLAAALDSEEMNVVRSTGAPPGSPGCEGVNSFGPAAEEAIGTGGGPPPEGDEAVGDEVDDGLPEAGDGP